MSMPTRDILSITIEDTLYKIRKMSPEDGTFWGFKALESMKGEAALLAQGKGDIAFSKWMDSLPRKMYEDFRRDTLKNVFTAENGREIPLVDEATGSFNFPYISLMTATSLILASMGHTLKDFFPKAAEAAQEAPKANPESANTSESTSSYTFQSSMAIGDNMSSGMEPTL